MSAWPGRRGAPELIGGSPAIVRVRDLLRRAAVEDGSLLITAEPGIRVEAVADELHRLGPRPAAPLVQLDCALVDAGRLERKLFGAMPPGAPKDFEWVSADSRIAMACGGTLFLHDVAELPAAVQARLARILRDGCVQIDGDSQLASFRLLASSPRAIDGDVHDHRFRPDLYRRLTVTRVDMPALRERPEDLPLLATRVLEDLCVAEGLPMLTFTHSALAFLGALSWPGNLTELHEVISRAVRNHDRRGVVQIEHLLPALRLQRAPVPLVPHGNLREARLRFEREYIASVLQHHRWRITDAAETLGIQRPNLYRKARQLGIPLTRVTE